MPRSTVARWSRRVGVLSLILAGCGTSAHPAPTQQPEQDLGADYVHVAERGCACDSAACLQGAHGELEEILSEIGGFDLAPAPVHAAHERFDECWRAGTDDLTRDLDEVASTLCRCFEPGCIEAFEEQAVTVQERYDIDVRVPAPEQIEPADRAALQRIAACVVARQIDGAAYLEQLRAHEARACSCTGLSCYERSSRMLQEAVGERFFITQADEVRDAVVETRERSCECLGRIGGREVLGSVGRALGADQGAIQIDLRVDCHADAPR